MSTYVIAQCQAPGLYACERDVLLAQRRCIVAEGASRLHCGVIKCCRGSGSSEEGYTSSEGSLGDSAQEVVLGLGLEGSWGSTSRELPFGNTKLLQPLSCFSASGIEGQQETVCYDDTE